MNSMTVFPYCVLGEKLQGLPLKFHIVKCQSLVCSMKIPFFSSLCPRCVSKHFFLLLQLSHWLTTISLLESSIRHQTWDQWSTPEWYVSPPTCTSICLPAFLPILPSSLAPSPFPLPSFLFFFSSLPLSSLPSPSFPLPSFSFAFPSLILSFSLRQ